MSGRLIILPKKSYCPWKPENVERVLRDERLERERLEREETELRQQESKQRLAMLKGTSSADAASAPQKHVNLFEPEERAMVKTALTGEKEKKQVGIVSVRLDSVMKKQDQPFYVRPSKARNDDRYKARMDPMKAFVRPAHKKNDGDAEDPHDDDDRNSSRKRSHHQKRSSRQDGANSEDSSRHDRKRKKRNSSNKGESANSVEELRRRRQERERTESQREATLRLQVDSRNDRHRHYQDQFHPGLSRR